ncbi:MAG: VOC family protein [Chlorobi bacterium]|nr:VOC family protein [Chlorobiota bacterium]
MQKIICGIQQVGIGVSDINEAWKWYRKYFGMDIRVFEEKAVAEIMLPHTDNKPRERHAALAMNMQGGGGFEIWQHTGKTPEAANFEIQLGDLGIFITKVKSKNVHAAHKHFKDSGLDLLSGIEKDPVGNEHFFIKDPYNNIFQIVSEESVFKKEKSFTGGTLGAVIGVSDIDKAFVVYRDILGLDEIVYDREGSYKDLKSLPGGGNKIRRVLLKHSKPSKGAFSKLLGPRQIELVQLMDGEPNKIYKDRIWGDLGFIHLCFDISGMDILRNECKSKGFPFTVDSGDSFDMGEAAGSFAYIADPDGTLIEFVETHKVPIIKKLGLYLKLRNRNPEKPLPDWMVKTLAFGRIKD